ncbi:hypothetical protein [Aurantimonas sp. VKM B-3413]|uniref:hypothetical protein n=1 Tax=Aurantimonas sp. VKM B-3413 TaxID=2779401 RepID=UPI001E566CED|nr:hypothetical protein [Aurantimonas sp. VKM B-3413]MCB8836831.1 hypothetical protein [Aurantimonas sp. VKM B-3413]
MTWVVGASSILGYGLMASDVRISFGDGTEADLLRKCFRVGPYLLAGFAGSVQIGLHLIDSLQHALHNPDQSEPGAWRPDWVAEQWAPIAAKLFESAPSAEQDEGCQILMVGVSPNEDMGVPEFPRVYVTRFNWPDFTPSHMDKGSSVCHIGSGADVESYEAGIASFFELGSPAMMAGIQAGPTGSLAMIGSRIGRIVSEHPVPGISPHVFIDAVKLGSFWSGTNDQTQHYADGRKVEFKMPKVASSYPQFLALCQELGKASARAVA